MVDSTGKKLASWLKKFGLSDYGPKLTELGYGDSPASLARLKSTELNDVYGAIEIVPNHKPKFQTMLESISLVCDSGGTKKPKAKRNALPFITAAAAQANLSQPAEQTEPKPIVVPVPEDRQRRIRFDSEDISAQHEVKQLREELNQAYEKIKRLEARLSKYESLDDEENKSGNLSFMSSPSTQAEDDDIPVIDFENPELGVSYDSSALRSTLAHIDIEEMCFCIAKVIHMQIVHYRDLSLSIEEPSNALVDMNIFQTLPTKSVMPDFFREGKMIKRIARKQEEKLSATLEKGLAVPADFDKFSKSLQRRKGGERLIKSEPYVQNEFDKIFIDPKSKQDEIPDVDQIYEYYKNIIHRCKMEKECCIVSLIYIEKLYKLAGIFITERNWKHLSFITLAIGSKVWDDESYENMHFAIVFPRYTKEIIAAMEGLFLELVQFNVCVKSSEYAKYYFILRAQADKSKGSFTLQPLDVDTVRKLQGNAEKASKRFEEIVAERFLKTN